MSPLIGVLGAPADRAAIPLDLSAVVPIDPDGPLDGAASCEVVVDVREVPGPEVLRRLRAVCGAGAVLVTLSRTAHVGELAAATGWDGWCCGLRAPGPFDRAGLLALVVPAGTAEAAVARCTALAGRLGRETERVDDDAAAVPVAVLFGLLAAAVRLVDDGQAERADVDTAVRLGLGWPAGPLELLDAIGPAAALDALTTLHARAGRRAFFPPPLLRRVVAAGVSAIPTDRVPSGAAGPAPDGSGAVGGGAGPRPVHRVGVVGTGTMAVGIAACTAGAGLPTVIAGRTAERAAAARDDAADRAPEHAGPLLSAATGPAALADCDLVVEAVVEDLAVKRSVFAALDAACRPGTVLATTTSSLAVLDCATATVRVPDVIGLHFFNPVPSMPLVELVGTLRSAPDALATGQALVDRLGKVAVPCRDRAGFLVNRLLFPFLNDALGAAAGGAVDGESLDRLLRAGLGIPLGPVRLLDVIGLDVALSGQESLLREFGDPDLAPVPLLTELVAAGVLGAKARRSIRRHPALAARVPATV